MRLRRRSDTACPAGIQARCGRLSETSPDAPAVLLERGFERAGVGVPPEPVTAATASSTLRVWILLGDQEAGGDEGAHVALDTASTEAEFFHQPRGVAGAVTESDLEDTGPHFGVPQGAASSSVRRG